MDYEKIIAFQVYNKKTGEFYLLPVKDLKLGPGQELINEISNSKGRVSDGPPNSTNQEDQEIIIIKKTGA